MANKNTEAQQANNRKNGNYFHGQMCHTGFVDKDKNPQNRRSSPWRGAAKNGKRRATDET
jgi:hypothetical protein